MATLKDVLRLVREEDTGKCDTAADGGEWWATDVLPYSAGTRQQRERRESVRQRLAPGVSRSATTRALSPATYTPATLKSSLGVGCCTRRWQTHSR